LIAECELPVQVLSSILEDNFQAILNNLQHCQEAQKPALVLLYKSVSTSAMWTGLHSVVTEFAEGSHVIPLIEWFVAAGVDVHARGEQLSVSIVEEAIQNLRWDIGRVNFYGQHEGPTLFTANGRARIKHYLQVISALEGGRVHHGSRMLHYLARFGIVIPHEVWDDVVEDFDLFNN
jgi:hypothetical protein